MKILIISDLHLGDKRNSLDYEKNTLRCLGNFISRGSFGAVLNLGDTVSRKEFLREACTMRGEFIRYRQWRDALGVPFRECSIHRERAVFRDVFGQNEDSLWEEIPGLAVVTLSPEDVEDHQVTAQQAEWLRRVLADTAGKAVLIGSHVPYPGSCSRPADPGIYLELPEDMQVLLAEHDGPVFWAGGHFHWNDDPPLVQGSLTAFMGARFAFEGDTERPSYMRILNLDDYTLQTIKEMPE